MLQRYQVILNITLDDSICDSPEEWDWDDLEALLKLGPHEIVEVEAVTEIDLEA